jgi:sugar-phosphatase
VPADPPAADLPADLFGGQVFEAVLLDLDGTLVDSTPAVERSWRRWARLWNVEDRLVVVHGVPARQVVAGYVAPADVDRAVADIERIEVDDVAGVTALPGAAGALAALTAGTGAVVTSGTVPLATARLRAAGLAAPRVLVTADDVRAGKPDPEPYLLAARRLGVDPGRCLVVEDAPAGVAAGRAAGCRVLALTTTHAASALAADALVATLADVRLAAGPDGVRVLPAAGRPAGTVADPP